MSAVGIYIILQQSVWCGLLVLGLLLLSIGFRLREDRTFALLGSGIVAICGMAGMDIWILFPGSPGQNLSKPVQELSQDLCQLFAIAFLLATLWYTRALLGRPGRIALWIQTSAATTLMLAFLADGLLPAKLFIFFGRTEWQTTWAYDWIFTPYGFILFGHSIYLTARGLKDARGPARRALKLILAAYTCVFLGGLADLIGLYVPGFIPDESGMAWGALAMGLLGTFIFTDKLILMYERQRKALLEVAEIHGAMEAQRPLGDLGRSAAQISEAIRGFVAGMKSDAHSLREDPSSGYRSEVARIESARRKLEIFTTGILDFSKSSRLGETEELDPGALTEACLRGRFTDRLGDIHVTAGAKAVVRGNPGKLERALAELIRNSLEAGAGAVAIRMRENGSVVSVALEDDGCGIGPGLRGKITHPFFTTRKASGACGLGACIAEGIIKAHGGSLRFYPKSGAGSRGLLANIILPKAGAGSVAGENNAARGAGEGRDCLLVSDDGARIEEFLAVCGNVGLRPLVLGWKDAGRIRGDSHAPAFTLLDADSRPSAWDGAVPGSGPSYRSWSGNLLSSQGAGERIFCEETVLEILSG